MRNFGIVVLVLIGFVVLTLGGYAFAIGMGWLTLAPHQQLNRVNTAHDVIDQSVNAQNCLQWQDWFRTAEANIQTLQQTVDNAQKAVDQYKKDYGSPSAYTPEQQQQYNILTDNLTGAQNEANDAINTYDKKSQEENFAICKSGLPVHIQPFSQ